VNHERQPPRFSEMPESAGRALRLISIPKGRRNY
jgi:hypothetical protein